MGPDEIEQMMDFVPFVPFRITLSSGDVVDVRQREGLSIVGLSLSILSEVGASRGPRLRFISIPNIAMVEPIATGSHGSESGEA